MNFEAISKGSLLNDQSVSLNKAYDTGTYMGSRMDRQAEGKTDKQVAVPDTPTEDRHADERTVEARSLQCALKVPL